MKLKLIALGSATLLLVAGYWYVRTTAYQAGYDAHKQEIAQANAEAARIAEERIAKIRRDYERRLQDIYNTPDNALPVGDLTSAFFERVREDYAAQNK